MQSFNKLGDIIRKMQKDFLPGPIISRQSIMVLNKKRVDLDWTLGRNSLVRGW